MSLADSFCGAIFPPHYRQTGRSSRAGFSQRVHDLHRLTRVERQIIHFAFDARGAHLNIVSYVKHLKKMAVGQYNLK